MSHMVKLRPDPTARANADLTPGFRSLAAARQAARECKKPDSAEIGECRPWLETEIELGKQELM